jgi:hypothetical protein
VKQREIHQNHVPGCDPHAAARIDDRALNVVAMHHAFGKTRGTRGIQGQHGGIRVDLPVALLQPRGGDSRRPGHERVPGMGAWPWVGPQDHHVP